MADSDDNGPLSRQIKRKRSSSWMAVSSPENGTNEYGSKVSTKTPVPTIRSKQELDEVIAKLRDQVLKGNHDTKHDLSISRYEIERLKTKWTKQKAESDDLKQRLERNSKELAVTHRTLIALEEEHQDSTAAMEAKQMALARAKLDIESLANLANDVVSRLRRTTFESKDGGFANIIAPLLEEFVQKYSVVNIIWPLEDVRRNPAALGMMDLDTKRHLTTILRGLRLHEHYQVFANPVTEDIAPHYSFFIKRPMDLSKIRGKLEADEYISLADFVTDAKLMFKNCRTYNVKVKTLIEAADAFEEQMRELMGRRGLFGL